MNKQFEYGFRRRTKAEKESTPMEWTVGKTYKLRGGLTMKVTEIIDDSDVTYRVKGVTHDGSERGWTIEGKYARYSPPYELDVVGPYEEPTVSPTLGRVFRTEFKNVTIDGFSASPNRWLSSDCLNIYWDANGKAFYKNSCVRWSNWDLLECFDKSATTPRPGDTVTVKTKVDQTFADGSISVGRIRPSGVLHVEPRGLQVGDVVFDNFHHCPTTEWNIIKEEWVRGLKWFVLGNKTKNDYMVQAADPRLKRKL